MAYMSLKAGSPMAFSYTSLMMRVSCSYDWMGISHICVESRSNFSFVILLSRDLTCFSILAMAELSLQGTQAFSDLTIGLTGPMKISSS